MEEQEERCVFLAVLAQKVLYEKLSLSTLVSIHYIYLVDNLLLLFVVGWKPFDYLGTVPLAMWVLEFNK